MGSSSEGQAIRSGSPQVIRLLEIANGIAIATPDRSPAGLSPLSDMLKALRDALEADVVFVAHFDEAQRRFIAVVKSRQSLPGIEIGGSDPILETYCRLVIERRIPPVIPDTMQLPLTAALPITKALAIAAYASAPVHLPDGSVFGTLCAVYHQPQPGLDPAIGQALRELADAIGRSLAGDGTFDHMTWSPGPSATGPDGAMQAALADD
jgi:GAF domain-containing protein